MSGPHIPSTSQGTWAIQCHQVSWPLSLQLHTLHARQRYVYKARC